MSISEEIRHVTINQEFHICQVCGYDRGFHTSLIRISSGHPHFRHIMICPECGTRYDVKWITNLR
ncbi:MAG TPA: hypothetical protein VMW63_02225 [Methanoregulaceae archaeon]|nr:hypothetical protein [Methanoregulaceae archaeon]